MKSSEGSDDPWYLQWGEIKAGESGPEEFSYQFHGELFVTSK